MHPSIEKRVTREILTARLGNSLGERLAREPACTLKDLAGTTRWQWQKKELLAQALG
jgi:hypothetical protein